MLVFVVLKWVFDLENNETTFSNVHCVLESKLEADGFLEKEEYIGCDRWVSYTVVDKEVK